MRFYFNGFHWLKLCAYISMVSNGSNYALLFQWFLLAQIMRFYFKGFSWLKLCALR